MKQTMLNHYSFVFVTTLILNLSAENSNTGKMVYLPNGVYHPFFKNSDDFDSIRLQAFYMDVLPVTNGDFLDFLKKHPRWQKNSVKPIFADSLYLKALSSHNLSEQPEKELIQSPLTYVSWFASKDYCECQGKRLPTTAEWEYAAQAGESEPVSSENSPLFRRILFWYSQPTVFPLPKTGSAPPNYWGIHDLHGLIFEWVADFNSALFSNDSRTKGGLESSLFCGSGNVSVTDLKNYAAYIRYAFRSSLKASYSISNLGFRCVKDLPLQGGKI